MSKVTFKTRQCKVVLSADDLKEQAHIMATSAQKLEDIEAEKKSANASFKERLERVSGDIRTAARLYKDGFDWRDVECAVVKDYAYGEILYIRVDTCELAHVESMTQAERQMHIDEAIKNEEGVGESVELTPGKQSGSDGGAEKSAEELRQEKETRRMMSSETSSLN